MISARSCTPTFSTEAARCKCPSASSGCMPHHMFEQLTLGQPPSHRGASGAPHRSEKYLRAFAGEKGRYVALPRWTTAGAHFLHAGGQTIGRSCWYPGTFWRATARGFDEKQARNRRSYVEGILFITLLKRDNTQLYECRRYPGHIPSGQSIGSPTTEVRILQLI